MAAVNLAAAKIANVVLGWPIGRTLLVCAVLNIIFAASAGLWGVLVTDFIQFGIAMTGSFAAAYFALKQPEVGGLSGLFNKIDPKTLSLLPVVVGLVSRSRTRWRQLYCPAHAGFQDRKGCSCRHAAF
jgi:Na+/proline symporter